MAEMEWTQPSVQTCASGPQPAVAKDVLQRQAAVGLRPAADSKRADENTIVFSRTEAVRDGYFTFRGACRAPGATVSEKSV